MQIVKDNNTIEYIRSPPLNGKCHVLLMSNDRSKIKSGGPKIHSSVPIVETRNYINGEYNKLDTTFKCPYCDKSTQIHKIWNTEMHIRKCRKKFEYAPAYAIINIVYNLLLDKFPPNSRMSTNKIKKIFDETKNECVLEAERKFNLKIVDSYLAK